MSNDVQAPFLAHLEDARRMIFACVGALLLCIIIAAIFISQLADILHMPLNKALGEGAAKGLITTGPMGVFSAMLQLCFLGGVGIALPFMLYFLARFIAPGLTAQERKVLLPACSAACALFLMGSAFAYFVLVPASLKASVYFNQMLGYETLWRADAYYGLLLWMTLGVGFAFEFPLLLVIAISLGLLTTTQLRTWRPYSIVGLLAICAVLTPTTDPLTFLFMAIPLWLLYEAAILVGGCIRKRTSA